MKIEKISDNQIRCTLTRADLADRQLQLSELAYGTEKQKSLFRDMMQQAAFEFGFEAEDIPLMIEAIPSADSIVLIITKVEDPEELDTRFSKFAPSSIADARKKNTPGKLEGAEGLLDLLGKVQESFEAQAAKSAPDTTSASGDDTEKKIGRIQYPALFFPCDGECTESRQASGSDVPRFQYFIQGRTGGDVSAGTCPVRSLRRRFQSDLQYVV